MCVCVCMCVCAESKLWLAPEGGGYRGVLDGWMVCVRTRGYCGKKSRKKKRKNNNNTR